MSTKTIKATGLRPPTFFLGVNVVKLFSSQCYKTFFGGNLDFPKLKKFNKLSSAD